jgi:uncharacterized membrane protein
VFAEEPLMTETTIESDSAPFAQRLAPLVIMGVALLIMALYSVTDSAHLAGDPVLGGADYVGYAVCHRITDRSFVVAGRQLPLCARCTGMYLAVSIVFAVLALAGRRRWSYLPPLKVVLVLVGLVGLMAIDGINSYSHFFPNLPHVYQPKNWLRLYTGLGAGLAMGIILFPALAQTLWRDQLPRPAIASLRELAGLTVLVALTGALALSGQPVILYVLGLVSAAGVLVVITAINTTALLIISRKDARAIRLRDAIPPLLVGLALAILQVALISFVRFSLTGTMTGFPGL